MKTTWYLHSHVVWLKALYSPIGGLPSVCVAAHGWKSADGPPDSSNCYCLPGRAGGSPADASLGYCMALIGFVVTDVLVVAWTGLRPIRLGVCSSAARWPSD